MFFFIYLLYLFRWSHSLQYYVNSRLGTKILSTCYSTCGGFLLKLSRKLRIATSPTTKICNMLCRFQWYISFIKLNRRALLTKYLLSFQESWPIVTCAQQFWPAVWPQAPCVLSPNVNKRTRVSGLAEKPAENGSGLNSGCFICLKLVSFRTIGHLWILMRRCRGANCLNWCIISRRTLSGRAILTPRWCELRFLVDVPRYRFVSARLSN